jgi:glutathione peroxidase
MSTLHRSWRQLLGFACALGVSAIAMAAEPGPSTRPATGPADAAAPTGPLDFTVTTIDGQEANLADYKGKVVLIVNVASKCGFTPQYAGLQKLYDKYMEKGFVILAFPANNFRKQEPGTNEEIKAFATSKYHVTFPLMAKISVAGDDQDALYRYLTSKETGGKFAGAIEWNFTKLLVGRDGTVVARFPSKVTPQDLKMIVAIEDALSAPEPARNAPK